MILVLLGTQDKPFTRLLDTIQKCIDNKVITEEVVVQAGHTRYNSSEMKIYDILPQEEYDKLIKKARILITHGGVSSILNDGIKNNLPVIAAARLKKYHEHTNDHQIQIVKKFADEGYILALENFDKLDEQLKKSKTFKPKKYISTTKNIINLIENYIDKN